jgi:hypothetical protein
MSRCIVHAGMNKTGTSSIQRSLYHGLADPRFHYVDMGHPNASKAITEAFAQPLSNAAAAQRERLAAQLAQAQQRCAILSAEGIGALAAPELQELMAWLRQHVSCVDTVVYVRSPASFMESVFQQHLKGGTPVTDPHSLVPRYRNRFGKLIDACEAQPVRFWHFDPRTLEQGCVVRDFCSRLDIAVDEQAIRRVNDSLSLPAIRLLYVQRRFGQQMGRDRARRENSLLIQALKTLPGPRLRFHQDWIQPALDAQREGIRWMESLLEKSLQEDPALRQGDTALRGEPDLLRLDIEAIDWLARQLDAAPRTIGAGPDALQDVADAMDRLAFRLSAAPRSGPGAPPTASPESIHVPPTQGLIARLRARLARAMRVDAPE